MDKKFNAVLSIALVPEVVALIAEREGLDELVSMNEFYCSKVYELLAKEETKVWHFSPMTIYMMWKNEKQTGNVVFPEG